MVIISLKFVLLRNTLPHAKGRRRCEWRPRWRYIKGICRSGPGNGWRMVDTKGGVTTRVFQCKKICSSEKVAIGQGLRYIEGRYIEGALYCTHKNVDINDKIIFLLLDTRCETIICYLLVIHHQLGIISHLYRFILPRVRQSASAMTSWFVWCRNQQRRYHSPSPRPSPVSRSWTHPNCQACACGWPGIFEQIDSVHIFQPGLPGSLSCPIPE